MKASSAKIDASDLSRPSDTPLARDDRRSSVETRSRVVALLPSSSLSSVGREPRTDGLANKGRRGWDVFVRRAPPERVMERFLEGGKVVYRNSMQRLVDAVFYCRPGVAFWLFRRAGGDGGLIGKKSKTTWPDKQAAFDRPTPPVQAGQTGLQYHITRAYDRCGPSAGLRLDRDDGPGLCAA